MSNDEWPTWARFASRIGLGILVAAVGFVLGVTLCALYLAGGL